MATSRVRRVVVGAAASFLLFSVGSFSAAQPALPPSAPFTFATFFGGSNDDSARAVATDADGNVYIAGDTESTDFPWTTKLYAGHATGRLAFVMKLTPDGSRVLYATLIGPAVAYDVAVDAAGHAYVTGETRASDFPTVNALQPVCASCDLYFPAPDAFLAKLDPSGTTLVYSTYLGGGETDWATAIAVDSAGRAVLVGQSYGSGLPTPPGVYIPPWSQQPEGPYQPAGFVAVIAHDGSALEMAARLHASIADVAIDASDRIHLGGRTEAEPGIPLARPTQAVPRGADAFAMRIASSGATLEFSTLIGGSDEDSALAVAVAPGGDILVGGYTSSDDLATPGAWQTTLHALGDAFVARLDPETPSVRYVSYLGGVTWTDVVLGLAVDATGRAVVVGATSSVDFPAEPPATDFARTTSIFVSVDGGQSVVPAQIVGPSATPSCFASSPADPGRVYAGGGFVGLLQSLDGGHSWTGVDHPLTNDHSVQAIVVASGRPTVVYAIVTRFATRLLKSTNAGQDWAVLDLPTTQSPHQLVADPFDPQALYVSAGDEWLRSRDGGSTWVRIDSGMYGYLAAHPGEPGRLFLSTASGLYTSATRGDSWYRLSDTVREVGSLEVSPADPAVAYLLTWQALYRTANGGQVWERVQGNDGGVHRWLALSTQDPNVLWLGGLDGLFRSGDGGRALTKVTSIPDQVYVSALAASAADPNELHVGVALWEPDAFFSILSPLGDALEYSVRLGGAGLDVLWNVAVAPDASAWVVGWADAPGLPVAGAIRQAPQGASDLYVARFDGTADHDDDGLPTWWEVRAGLDPDLPNADDDDDGDGLTNREEFERGTHPRGFVQRYLAEGVTGSFFETRVNVVNPGEADTASVHLRFLTDAGETVSEWLKVPPRTRRTVTLNHVPGLANAAVSTTIESDVPVAVDRTVTWDGTGYGAHAGQAIEAPEAAWYFAEGATTPGFELYYLVENPNDVPAAVRFTWLPADGRGEIVRDYTVAPLTRLTIQANAVPGLEHAEIALVVTTDEETPVVAERAMYRHAPGRLYEAGHGGAGVTAPATEWYLAEGATGPFFDLFVLVANPSTSDAPIEVRYLLPDGRTIVKSHVVGARQRHTIWVDLEDPDLVDTAVSTTVTSVEGVPIVVERAMWWPGPTYHTWHGAHVAAGTTTPASAWALADGEIRGPGRVETYVLLGNPGTVGGEALVTLLFDDGATATERVWVGPHSRMTVNVLASPWVFSTPSLAPRFLLGTHFGVLVEALDPGLEFVVETAIYGHATGSAGRQAWASGRCTLATPVRQQ